MNNKLKISLVLVLIVALPGIAYSLNTILTGYQTTSSDVTIFAAYDGSGEYQSSGEGIQLCNEVRHTGSTSYFVPTKTLFEHSSFINSNPSDTSVVECPVIWEEDTDYLGGTTCGADNCDVSEGDPCTFAGDSCIELSGTDPKTGQCFYDKYD